MANDADSSVSLSAALTAKDKEIEALRERLKAATQSRDTFAKWGREAMTRADKEIGALMAKLDKAESEGDYYFNLYEACSDKREAKALLDRADTAERRVAELEIENETLQDQTAKACIEAAIASGSLVPASAVAEMRERCAKAAEKEAEFWQEAESSSALIAADKIRQLDIAPWGLR